MNDSSFIVSKEDWSLHRKGHQDQSRHQEKVKEAIKKNLSDLVSEENIIMSNGREIIKIPIRSLDEYRFRYNFNKGQHIGQGKGNSKIGDVIAKDGDPTDARAGQGQGAGDQPGNDYYEAEITVEELQEMLFSELELPNLQTKDEQKITIEDIQFNDVRKKGLMGNIDKKRTLISAIRRNALAGYDDLELGISMDDLRFKTWEEIVKPHSNAVILAMMDTSGSISDP